MYINIYIYICIYGISWLFCCGYCATSQGSLDCFEVDLMCPPSFLIQSDLCVVYFYYILCSPPAILFPILDALHCLSSMGCPLCIMALSFPPPHHNTLQHAQTLQHIVTHHSIQRRCTSRQSNCNTLQHTATHCNTAIYQV